MQLVSNHRTNTATAHKNFINKKSKRKQNLVKKAHELAKLANLKVTLIIFDPLHNIMQEFNTSAGFDVEKIAEHKLQNEAIKLDTNFYKNICRK